MDARTCQCSGSGRCLVAKEILRVFADYGKIMVHCEDSAFVSHVSSVPVILLVPLVAVVTLTVTCPAG